MGVVQATARLTARRDAVGSILGFRSAAVLSGVGLLSALPSLYKRHKFPKSAISLI